MHGRDSTWVADALQALEEAGFPCAELECNDEAAAAILVPSNFSRDLLVGIRTSQEVYARQAIAGGAAWVTVPASVACHLPEGAVIVIDHVSEGETLHEAQPVDVLSGVAHAARLAARDPTLDAWQIVDGSSAAQEDAAALMNPRVLAVRYSVSFAHETASLFAKAAEQRWVATLGFALAHVGVNAQDEDEARRCAELLAMLLGCSVRDAGKAFFTGEMVEWMKAPGAGRHGHIGFYANRVDRAMASLARKGFTSDPAREMRDGVGRLTFCYLKEEICGFAIHLMERRVRD